MAILLDTSTGTKHVLKPYHVFGRSTRHADCVLPTPAVSLIHAYVRWDAHRWTVTDESRNGSYVNGHRLAKDQATPLNLGDDICFGTMDMSPWKVVDLSAPSDLLLPLSLGQNTIKLESFQNLPNDAEPLACIYRSSSGQWVEETKDGVTLLNNGDTVYIGGHAWRLMCAEDRLNTLIPTSLVTCMKFQTSLDEEHVFLTLVRGRSTLDLGEQTHHYLLMLLASQRLTDVAEGLEPDSQGWMEFDSLVKKLDMDKAHLHIHIFRLRKEFEHAVAQGLIQQDFIERRRGGVRLGNVAVEIWRGARLEGTWSPEKASRFAA
jgi:pSer/pThr/pTyr-binding forkhead associated (FHA) protein